MKYLLGLLIPTGLFRRWRYSCWEYPTERVSRWTGRREYRTRDGWVCAAPDPAGFVVKGNSWE